MAEVIIKIDGVDVTEDVVLGRATFKALADGQPGTAQITIDDRNQAYSSADIRAGMTLELFIDGQREWDGWVFTIGRGWPLPADDTADTVSVPRFWNITGYDRNLLFQKRLLYRVADPSDDQGLRTWPEDTADKTAIEYALEHYVDLSGDGLDITSGIEQIGSPGPFEEFTLGYVSAPLGVLFDDCAKMTGGVFFIDPDRVLRYVDDLTVTAPFILSDDPTEGEGYREFEAVLDFTGGANEALVWGAGKGSSDPVFSKYTNADSVAAHELWQWGDIFIGAWRQQTVNRRARTYVEGSPSHRRGHGDPVPSVACIVFAPGLRVGHVVDFRASQFGGYQQALPIRSMTMTFPTPTLVRYELEMTLKVDSPFGAPDLWSIRFPPPFDPRESLPPEGPGGVRGGDPGGGGGDVLIDHFDQVQLVAAEAVGPTTFPDPDDPELMPFSVPIPEGVIAGDLAMVTVAAAQGFVATEPENTPLGWTVLEENSSYSEGIGWSFATYYRILSGPEAAPIFKIGIGGDLAPFPEVAAHITVWRGALSIELAKPYGTSADATWSWDGGALLVAAPRGGGPFQPGWDPVLTTDMLEESSSVFPLLRTASRYELTSPFGGTGSSTAIVALQIASLQLVLPGPEITGSEYAGGNPYFIDPGDAYVLDSELYFAASESEDSGGWSVRDALRSTASPTQGEIVDPYPETYPDSAFSHRAKLLLKFRMTGANDIGWLIFVWGLTELAPEQAFTNKMVIMFDLYWNWDGPATDSWIDVGNDAYGQGPNEEWYSAYLSSPLVPETDYYLLFDGGTEDRIRFKYWVVGDDEPEAWLADLPLSQFEDTDDPPVEYNEVSVEWGSAFPGDSIRLDAWWERGALGGTGAFVTDTPIYDNALSEEQSSLYVTSYPYRAASLVVYYEGIRLRPNVDYIETDPSSGEFRILGGRDVSQSLFVRYSRAGSDPTTSGGRVYRPKPVLQYGWGTPLDGYNCTMACSVMALDRHSLGAHTPFVGTPRSTPPTHRGFQNDQVGGTDLSDVALAWDNGWGQTLFDPGGSSWSTFAERVAAGRGAILQGVYSALPASKRFSTFSGGHALYINERFANGNFWGCDPLYRYPIIYTTADLQAYASAFAGTGSVQAAYTQVTT